MVIERAESMDRVVNLFAGAKIAREAGAVEQVDTDRLLDERDAPFECTICLDSIVDPISLLECGHIFHQACLESQARSGRRECSVCRAQMRIAPVDTIRALVEWARGRPLLAREEAGAGGEVRGRKRRERSESPESPRQRARERSPSPDLL